MMTVKRNPDFFYFGRIAISQYRMIGWGVFLIALAAPYFSPLLEGSMDPNAVTWMFLGGIFAICCEIAHHVVYEK